MYYLLGFSFYRSEIMKIITIYHKYNVKIIKYNNNFFNITGRFNSQNVLKIILIQ